MIEKSNTRKRCTLLKTYGCSYMYYVGASPLLIGLQQVRPSWTPQASTPPPEALSRPPYCLWDDAGRGFSSGECLESPEAWLDPADDPPDPPLWVERLAAACAVWSLSTAPALLARTYPRSSQYAHGARFGPVRRLARRVSPRSRRRERGSSRVATAFGACVHSTEGLADSKGFPVLLIVGLHGLIGPLVKRWRAGGWVWHLGTGVAPETGARADGLYQKWVGGQASVDDRLRRCSRGNARLGIALLIIVAGWATSSYTTKTRPRGSPEQDDPSSRCYRDGRHGPFLSDICTLLKP